MVEHLRLCYVATVTPDGKPNLSPKGSLKVWDDETVEFADIASTTNIAWLAHAVIEPNIHPAVTLEYEVPSAHSP